MYANSFAPLNFFLIKKGTNIVVTIFKKNTGYHRTLLFIVTIAKDLDFILMCLKKLGRQIRNLNKLIEVSTTYVKYRCECTWGLLYRQNYIALNLEVRTL